MRLLCDGVDVANVVRATTPWQRTKGLLGTKEIDGAMLFDHTTSVHTFFMRYTIDVAFVTPAKAGVQSFAVLDIQTLKPFKLSKRVEGARHVLEAAAGSFEQWKLWPGCELEIT